MFKVVYITSYYYGKYALIQKLFRIKIVLTDGDINIRV